MNAPMLLHAWDVEGSMSMFHYSSLYCHLSRRHDMHILLRSDQIRPAEDVNNQYQQTFAAQMDGWPCRIRMHQTRN